MSGRCLAATIERLGASGEEAIKALVVGIEGIPIEREGRWFKGAFVGGSLDLTGRCAEGVFLRYHGRRWVCEVGGALLQAMASKKMSVYVAALVMSGMEVFAQEYGEWTVKRGELMSVRNAQDALTGCEANSINLRALAGGCNFRRLPYTAIGRIPWITLGEQCIIT
jgi:hypothetical protein